LEDIKLVFVFSHTAETTKMTEQFSLDFINKNGEIESIDFIQETTSLKYS
jgi:hypothetical protein